MSIIWYINIQITSLSKIRSHVDIQVRSNVVLGIYTYMHVRNVLDTLHHFQLYFKLK